MGHTERQTTRGYVTHVLSMPHPAESSSQLPTAGVQRSSCEILEVKLRENFKIFSMGHYISFDHHQVHCLSSTSWLTFSQAGPAVRAEVFTFRTAPIRHTASTPGTMASHEYVVVGGGIAGVSVCEELLRQLPPKRGPDGVAQVLLVSASEQLKGVRACTHRCSSTVLQTSAAIVLMRTVVADYESSTHHRQPGAL